MFGEIITTRMSPIFPLTTKAWLAILLVAGLLVCFAIYTGEVLIPIAVFCTSAIAAFDSSHILLRRYKTGISYGPVGLFLICALIWPFAIVWYFIVRVRIARGSMPLRDEVIADRALKRILELEHNKKNGG